MLLALTAAVQPTWNAGYTPGCKGPHSLLQVLLAACFCAMPLLVLVLGMSMATAAAGRLAGARAGS